jgi:hypothetical protein
VLDLPGCVTDIKAIDAGQMIVSLFRTNSLYVLQVAR